MDTEIIKANKNRLEDAITQLVEEFENQTKLKVTRIHFKNEQGYIVPDLASKVVIDLGATRYLSK
jgi:hypothetical protein